MFQKLIRHWRIRGIKKRIVNLERARLYLLDTHWWRNDTDNRKLREIEMDIFQLKKQIEQFYL